MAAQASFKIENNLTKFSFSLFSKVWEINLDCLKQTIFKKPMKPKLKMTLKKIKDSSAAS